jgi:Asp-tRNA(Asn)/Glu-tRNA(Gln) amidotransferase C subunit
MLDLLILQVTKRHIARVNKLKQVNIQTNHIREILQEFCTIATPANIVSSFRNSGVSLFMDDQTRAIML